MSRGIELLAPAKNLECGIAAVDHGADAVYIGAERFSARSAAGNSVDDIHRLCEYAHTFMVKVYVTVNTILFDEELEDTRILINMLYSAGVDAIVVQDMGILKMEIPPITLHASTQTDNRTVDKVKWLGSHGFSRIVLARELSVSEISQIHDAAPDIELEVFVHGALCVSYSGICNASQYCFKRSANRGECAQFCRLRFNLEDADGNMIERDKYLLSLKDMCRLDQIGDLLKAGATSLKIEGRLKDATYIKNVTAAYNKKLNEIISNNPDVYHRTSLGRCEYSFSPNLNKTFNRGFTHYFLNGRESGVTSFDTPKSTGEYVGNVKEITGNSFNVSGTASFTNGDGLCFFNNKNELEGFRINKVVNNRLYPLKVPESLRPGKALYRNHDMAFEKLLSNKSGKRKIPLSMTLGETPDGFALTAIITGVAETTITVKIEKQTAQKPQREYMTCQLTKFGNTPFECSGINFIPADFKYFIPASLLSEMRCQAAENIIYKLRNTRSIPDIKTRKRVKAGSNDYPEHLTYLYNISNNLSRKFYMDEGKERISDAFELKQPAKPLLMQCRHCIRFSSGHCTKRGDNKPEWKEPLFIRLADGRRFRLQFNCHVCQMNIYATK